MTAGVSLGVRRRAPAPTREELRRQLLALVLAFVLVWYTLVVPAGSPARSHAGAAPDDDGLDGEVRGPGGAGQRGGAGREKAGTQKAEPQKADELDWPEYIYP